MKRLQWDKGNKNAIKITGKEFHGYDKNEKPIYKDKELGELKFMDKKDAIRFGLHVAKNLGISQKEFKILSEEVIKETGDWN